MEGLKRQLALIWLLAVIALGRCCPPGQPGLQACASSLPDSLEVDGADFWFFFEFACPFGDFERCLDELWCMVPTHFDSAIRQPFVGRLQVSHTAQRSQFEFEVWVAKSEWKKTQTLAASLVSVRVEKHELIYRRAIGGRELASPYAKILVKLRPEKESWPHFVLRQARKLTDRVQFLWNEINFELIGAITYLVTVHIGLIVLCFPDS